MNFNYKLFASDILAFRKKNCQLSMRDMATIARVSAPTICRAESAREIDMQTFVKICSAIKRPVTRYFTQNN